MPAGLTPEITNFLAVMATFPTERLTRCGATSVQQSAQRADWNTRPLQWRAQMGTFLDSQSDPIIVGFIASWPPAIPTPLNRQWPFGATDGLFSNGDQTWTWLSEDAPSVDNGDGTSTYVSDSAWVLTDNLDGTSTLIGA